MTKKKEEKPDEAAENTKAVAKIDNNKELAKKENKEAKMERVLKAFSKSRDFSDYYIEEYVDLSEKKELTAKVMLRAKIIHRLCASG